MVLSLLERTCVSARMPVCVWKVGVPPMKIINTFNVKISRCVYVCVSAALTCARCDRQPEQAKRSATLVLLSLLIEMSCQDVCEEKKKSSHTIFIIVINSFW